MGRLAFSCSCMPDRSRGMWTTHFLFLFSLVGVVVPYWFTCFFPVQCQVVLAGTLFSRCLIFFQIVLGLCSPWCQLRFSWVFGCGSSLSIRYLLYQWVWVVRGKRKMYKLFSVRELLTLYGSSAIGFLTNIKFCGILWNWSCRYIHSFWYWISSDSSKLILNWNWKKMMVVVRMKCHYFTCLFCWNLLLFIQIFLKQYLL